ncbi:hypothetical protein F3Y22_tig00110860pilonHSYRG00043 [Hibiscus syriacus]|uniref:Integrase catalytic domain-containing protein n=1 Tax=Hibiscus syriacus TaxID=106335 RepID=A0A6A2ZK19_HIBSY|nr:hypothetical protein F3Y22_tig00110860pilonHSYRG00043 [Hibiscus syriacus]
MVEVVDCSTACDAWLALEASFSHSSKTWEIQLKDELQLMQRGSRGVAEYARSFRSLCDQLSAIGKPVDDTDKVHWFLRGLGSDFKIFSTTMLSQLPLPSFSNLVPKALSHELFSWSLNGDSSSQSILIFKRGVICQWCGKERHTAKKCHKLGKLLKKAKADGLIEAFAATSVDEPIDSEWYTDTGATSHMTNDVAALDNSVPYTGNQRVYIGNGTSMPISRIGSISSIVTSHPLPLSDVLLVPNLTKNLLSISNLTRENNCLITFSSSSFTIHDLATRTVVGVKRCEKGLYVLDRGHASFLSSLSKCTSRASSVTWHPRLGHPSFRIVSSLNKHGAITLSHNNKIDSKPCFGCQLGKIHRLPFSNSDQRCASLFERIYCDLWGPSPITSPSGYKYYCVLIDDFSRFSWFYPLKLKSDFFDIFVQFNKYVQIQFDCKIKSFQCDGGTAFTNHHFTSFLRENGIIQRIACPYTPNQNGISERKHRHITETGLTLMFLSHVPLRLWVESFSTACYLINRISSPVLHDYFPYASNSTLPSLDGVDYVTFDDPSDSFLPNNTSSSVTSAPRPTPTLCVPCADSSILSPPPEDSPQTLSSTIALEVIPPVPSSSSQLPTTTHPIVTRAKNDIVKPRTIYSLCALSAPLWFQFRSLAGALQYLTLTRPDLSYSVNSICQYMHASTTDHFRALKRILRYVKGTYHYGLQLSRDSSSTLLGYSDADWAGCPVTRCSTTGYTVYFGQSLISWCSKKQTIVARSSAEVEYRALASVAAELSWALQLLRELHITLFSPPRLLCDNQSAIFMASNPVTKSRFKHIDIDYHFVRELVARRVLSLGFVPSHLQLADVFTKGVPKLQFLLDCSKLCVLPISPTPTLRGDIRGESASPDCDQEIC